MVWLRIALPLVVGVAVAQSTIPFRARTKPNAEPPARRAFPIGRPMTIPTPLGLPPVPIPADNPPTAETVALGHRLFFDKIFSRDNTVSCASCHDPKAGGADPRQFSEGVDGLKGNRNAPAIFNAAYNDTQFWDGRAVSLEHQAEGPVGNPVEFAHSLSGVVRKLMGNPVYVDLFAKAWGPGPITYEMVAKSIASYERTLVSGNSPFDRYQYGGDRTAMSESAIRGLRLFLDPSLKAANCISCHRIDEKFATFAEERFHNTGVAWDPRRGILMDMGRWAIVQRIRWQGAFRTPTLRNITLTGPYMHDGSMKTLEEVIDFYFEGGRPNPWISNDMPDPGLPDIPRDQQPQAKRDLVEFMKHLNGEVPALAGPPE
jgi:cytochrome c peroxidase